MKWTDDQLAAIESRGENLLLSAAAGSGKTAVLVERVARLLIEGADIEKMLIVTFTRASAADMKDSLTRRLEKLAQGENPALREQAERVDRASISTIHAFCTDFLRAFFQAGGVDPAFRIADGAETAILREKALSDALRDHYAQSEADFLALSELRSAQEVHDLALALHSFLMERPDPFEWLNEQIASMERGEDRFSPELVRGAKRQLSQARAVALQALRAAQEGAEHYLPALQSDLDALDQLLNIQEYTPLKLSLMGWEMVRLPSKRGTAGDPCCEQVKSLREQVKKLVKGTGEVLAPDLAEALSDLKENAAELRALGQLVRDLHERFEQYKAARSLLTFSDLEHRTLRALSVEGVKKSIQERFDYVFVDEYQDVSDVQEAILSQVSRGDNLFCVGDMKQSIYRFRHAEPGLFAQKAQDYARGQGGRLIALKSNFRSRAGVLNFTNAVFERAMCGGESEITYDEMHRLHPAADYELTDPPVEICLCGRESGEEEADSEAAEELSSLKEAEFEALYAARRIKQLLGSTAWDAKKGCEYTLSYRHFVILTRKARNVAQYVTRILKDQGIPACADLSGGFFEVLEVRVALSLLRLIDNRQRDMDWISALRSPAVRLSSEQLGEIRAFTPEGSYSAAVLRYAQEQQDPTAQLLRDFIGKLDAWRELSGAIPLARLLFMVLRDTGLYAYMGALPAGSQRQANLDALISRAEGYEANQSGGLYGFLQYVEQLTAAQEDMGEAHTLSENDDVVRVMTVHKSKGLEFPVVIGIQLGGRIARAQSDLLCAHKQLGLGMEHIDRALGTRRDTLSRMAISARMASENNAEALRILYVLLTRAKERLILIGSAKKPEQKLREAASSLHRPLFERDFLDSLLPAALRMPGSEVFWDLVGEIPQTEEAFSPILCSLTSPQKLGLAEQQEGLSDEQALSELLNRAEESELDSRFAWVYPHTAQATLPGKLTASALAREIPDEEQDSLQVTELVEQPAFLSETDQDMMTGAQRGTAMHRCLQGLDLAALRALPPEQRGGEIARQADQMAAMGRLTQPERDSLRISRLTAFLQSKVGQRLLAARTVQREWMFTLRLSAEEAGGQPGGAPVLVQGQIDCCFEEEGGWVLLDYKTDRGSDPSEIAARYRTQLALYQKALEKITGRPVIASYLCLLSLGVQVSMTGPGENT